MNDLEYKAKPFLKWAGGKTQLLQDIISRLPFKNQDSFIYVEPFVGSGAVLFYILNNYPNIKTAVINDINEDLINSYKIIKSDVEKLVPVLKKIEYEYHNLLDNPNEQKAYYYDKRNLFNTKSSRKLIQTALLIFLNKTCFNGLYRVNKNNKYNVPVGSYKKPRICDQDNLFAVSKLLQKVEILSSDFEETEGHITKNSFFYFDPPYKPISKTSNFNSYAQDTFNDKEQIRLKEFCDRLDLQGCKWILSNSDVRESRRKDSFFDDLFKQYKVDRVTAKRSINSKADKRGSLAELLVLNF